MMGNHSTSNRDAAPNKCRQHVRAIHRGKYVPHFWRTTPPALLVLASKGSWKNYVWELCNVWRWAVACKCSFVSPLFYGELVFLNSSCAKLCTLTTVDAEEFATNVVKKFWFQVICNVQWNVLWREKICLCSVCKFVRLCPTHTRDRFRAIGWKLHWWSWWRATPCGTFFQT